MPITIDCFKAYDVRGQIPNQLNPDVAYRIGNATAEFLQAKTIVVGRDMRLSSAELTDAVCRGITEAGADVLDIGLCGTEMVYFG
ncbi:MAG TPA: phosphomannomutase CpsG, partial [Vicinamibacterales bacterium]|nr:phosphomannomutase CpsG [Vicinamibacterales bacterium]